ncbi:12622_t:CDS:1, partial [Entrophospora sp. SA101]
KVDTAITFTYNKHLLFLLIGETKLPFARTKGLHEKLISELNGTTNDS